MKIAITGHRPHRLGNDYALTGPLSMKIKDNIVGALISSSPSVTYTGGNVLSPDYKMQINDVTGITGMALGIDTLYALICIEYGIPFIAAIPFKGQERIWPQQSQDRYFSILQQAESIHVCDINLSVNWLEYQALRQTSYRPELMDLRNKWMVDNSDKLIGVWDGSAGGTANCINYATSRGKEIIQINPKEL